MAAGLISGTTTVPGNATQVSVIGSFAATYQVTLTPSWITDVSVTAKTTTFFTVAFGVSAPVTGGVLDWFVAINVTLLPFGTTPPVADVTIASDALVMLGEAPIASFDDVSDAAAVMKRLYPQARDATLRSHPWNFAMVRHTLAALTAYPDTEGEAYLHYYF